MELVSILVPVYNRESIILETLQSALDQSYEHFEIIVVDNASTDDTYARIVDFSHRDDRIKVFQNDTNLGPVRNWLRCVEEASGEYGKILWSDDMMAPNFLEKTLPYFSDDVGFVHTGIEFFSDSWKRVSGSIAFHKSSGTHQTAAFINNALYWGRAPKSPGCAIFRMKDIRDCLLLDVPNSVGSDFSMHAIGNDMLLFLLVARRYPKYAYVFGKLSFFRGHTGSISLSSRKGELQFHYALAKAYYVETYDKRGIYALALYIKFLMWKYRNSADYGLNHLEDFFPNNKSVGGFISLFRGFFQVVVLHCSVNLSKVFRILQVHFAAKR